MSENQHAISLYFNLREGEFAKLESVAKSALAFSAALKDAAYVIDPSLEIAIELRRGKEGSLSLDAIIKKIKEAAEGPPTNLKTIAIVCALWVAGQSTEYAFSYVADNFFKDPENQSISDEDVQKIAERVVAALRNKDGEEHIREIFVELEHDEAIDGVGVSLEAEKKPDFIVPRAEFRRRAGKVDGEVAHKRTVYEDRSAILISPVLINKPRKWKFQFSDLGERSLKINDQAFVDKVLTGKSNMPMKGNIEMIVRVGFDQEKIDGVWVIKDIFVDKVLKYPEANRMREVKDAARRH